MRLPQLLAGNRNADGNYVGRRHTNPVLDSRIYTICFPDGDKLEIAYNILAEQLYLQIDKKGDNISYSKLLLITGKIAKQLIKKTNIVKRMDVIQRRRRRSAGNWKSNGKTVQPAGFL